MSIVVNIGTFVALKRSRDIGKGEAAAKEGTVVWDFPLTISGMNIVGAFFPAYAAAFTAENGVGN